MHPTLSLHNNPLCVDKILAFKQCHEDVGYWGRLTGACNEQKYLLEKCFKAQKKVIRKGLLEKAREELATVKAAYERETDGAKKVLELRKKMSEAKSDRTSF